MQDNLLQSQVPPIQQPWHLFGDVCGPGGQVPLLCAPVAVLAWPALPLQLSCMIQTTFGTLQWWVAVDAKTGCMQMRSHISCILYLCKSIHSLELDEQQYLWASLGPSWNDVLGCFNCRHRLETGIGMWNIHCRSTSRVQTAWDIRC